MKKLLLISILLIVGCVPLTFSNIQSAKMVDKGKFEFTPSYSSSFNTNYYGLQTAYGLSEKYNLRFRIEKIRMNNFDKDSSKLIDLSLLNDITHFTNLSIGLKYQLKNNKSSFYLPISIIKSDFNNQILFKSIDPTYIRTFDLNEYIEITPSLKTIVPIQTGAKGAMFALNIGLGISNKSSKFVIRPEIGSLLFSGIYHTSIGLSIYP